MRGQLLVNSNLCYIWYGLDLVPDSELEPETEPHRNFSKLGIGSSINHYGSTILDFRLVYNDPPVSYRYGD
jgi:hypothetical protein